MATVGGERLALASDIGGTNVRVAVVDSTGTIHSSVKRPLAGRNPDTVVREIVEGAKDVLLNLGLTMEAIGGVGVGIAGQCLGSSGVVLVGPNLGWRDVRFGEMLQLDLGRPVRVVNDLSAAAWGEAMAGAARGYRDVILVFVGSGVGSGLILGGRLYEGAGGIAGEFGHIKVVPGGRMCGCGERGCLEAYVGGHNITRRLQEMVQVGGGRGILAMVGGDASLLSGSALEVAATAGDRDAIALREEMAQMLGVAIGNVVTLLNPSRVVLGGGVLQNMPDFRKRVVEQARLHGSAGHIKQVEFVEAGLRDDAGLIGAGLLALADIV